MCMIVLVWVYAHECRCPKLMCYLIWVLGTEPGSFVPTNNQ